jgi:hypothetical protein
MVKLYILYVSICSSCVWSGAYTAAHPFWFLSGPLGTWFLGFSIIYSTQLLGFSIIWCLDFRILYQYPVWPMRMYDAGSIYSRMGLGSGGGALNPLGFPRGASWSASGLGNMRKESIIIIIVWPQCWSSTRRILGVSVQCWVFPSSGVLSC